MAREGDHLHEVRMAMVPTATPLCSVVLHICFHHYQHVCFVTAYRIRTPAIISDDLTLSATLGTPSSGASLFEYPGGYSLQARYSCCLLTNSHRMVDIFLTTHAWGCMRDGTLFRRLIGKSIGRTAAPGLRLAMQGAVVERSGSGGGVDAACCRWSLHPGLRFNKLDPPTFGRKMLPTGADTLA